MIKDITLGQYMPGNSLIHRIDPRVKIMITIAYVAVLFLVNTLVGYLLFALFIWQVLHISKISVKFIFKGIKPLIFFIAFTAALNIFMTDGRVIFNLWGLRATYEGVYIAIIMALRLIFLVAGTSMLTYTTSPLVLTYGIENLLGPFRRFGLPAHELAMMMTIAIRFIPTIIEETDKIMKAQSARGASFDTGGIIKRARAMIPLLIPLFISAFRRADELALAMECRCYRGGENRTRMNELRISKIDVWASIYVSLFFCVVIAIRYIPVLQKLLV